MKNKSPVTKVEELNIEKWDIEKVIPYEKNAKIHTDEQVDKLVAIIKERGFRRPITVDEDGVIIAGHGRRLAAIKLGMKKVPVIVERHLTEEQKMADRISDNMVSRGDFDSDLLGAEIAMLMSDEDFNFGMLAMDESEATKLLSDNFFSEEDFDNILDEEPEPIATPDAPLIQTLPKEKQYVKKFTVVVDCANEDEQEDVYNLLVANGNSCRIQTI